MEQQMITYKFKSETKSGHLFIVGDRIDVKSLKKQIAVKSGSKEEELVLDDEQTGDRLRDSDFVKSFSVVVVERINPLNMYSTVQPITTPPTATSVQAAQELLDGLTDRARYFMIKSSNEDNIRIAKEKEIWATTFINQRKLKEAYDESANVLLFFKANNSNNLQGLARMEEKPSDTPNKSVWAGVDTIKLGGNFRIKWLSRGLVAASRFENQINPLTRQYVSRSGDVQEIQRVLGKRMVSLFEISTEAEIAAIPKSAPIKPENFINIDEILNPNGYRPKSDLPIPGLPFAPPPPPGVRMYVPPPPPFPMHYNYNPLYHQQMMYMNMLTPQPAKSESKEKEKDKPRKNRSQDSRDSDSSSDSSSDEQSSRSSRDKRSERRQRKRKSRKSHTKERKQSKKRSRKDRKERKKRNNKSRERSRQRQGKRK